MKEASADRKPIEGRLVAIMLFLTAIVAVWFGAKRWLPPLASAHGAGIDLMIN